MATSTEISELKINYLTEAQYNSALSNNQINSNEIYMTPSSDGEEFSGATTSAKGKSGLVPAPAAGSANRYLRSDGTWTVPPDNNTTYSNMTAATSSTAGKAGLVPAPAAGKQTSFLRGDGAWVVPTNTTYPDATTSAHGLMTAAMVTKLNGIATNANNYSLPTASSSTIGGVKTSSTVTSTNGLTACPIISGIPYYKDTNTTYTLSSITGTLAVSKGGTGSTTATNARTNLGAINFVSQSYEPSNQNVGDLWFKEE